MTPQNTQSFCFDLKQLDGKRLWGTDWKDYLYILYIYYKVISKTRSGQARPKRVKASPVRGTTIGHTHELLRSLG